MVPGDPALALFRARYGEQAVPVRAQVEAVRREAGFDRPLAEQYVGWLTRAAGGDLGRSFTRRRPVLPLVLQRLPVSLGLALGALALAVALAIPTAVLSARRPRLMPLLLTLTQAILAAAEYVVALLLMLVFAVKLHLLPVSGWATPAAYVLPATTLALRPWATYTRLIAAGLNDARHADWMRTGRAKGLSEQRLLYRHALPHAMYPVVSVLGAAASGVLGAALVAEVIFAIPGTGRLLYEAIGDRDIPLIQACLMIQVALAVLANATADAGMRWLHPALRRQTAGSAGGAGTGGR